MGIIWNGVKAVGKGIGHAAYSGMEAIGGVAERAGKAAWNAAPGVAEKIGDASLYTAEGIGHAAGVGIKTGGTMMVGAGKMVGDLIEYNPKKYTNSLFGAEFSRTGKTLMIGAGLIAGTAGAYNEYETTQMGTPSGEVASPTPSINYTRFGEEMGATGDLVFAMNRNRRGRF